MPKKKTAKNHFQRAREKGAVINTGIVNGDEIQKKPQPCTERKYETARALWDEWIEDGHPGADPKDIETSKDFARDVAYGIDGMHDDPKAAVRTVLNYYRNFAAARRRDNLPLPGDTSRCIRNFIKGPLREEMDLALTKRVRRYCTRNHFIHLATQLWLEGVQDTWDKGEYLESTARAGSNRGLYYGDITFGVFRNEHGRAEFGIQVIHDAKNMTETPHKRPEHSVHEGLEPRPLFFNPVLTMLAKAVADDAFRDYRTLEGLLELELLDDEMHQIHFKQDVLNKPSFEMSNGKIQKANSFGKGLRDLGFRAGYLRPPTIHDFRAEGLYPVI